MNNKPCAFIWHDLITTDVAGAKAFYAKVIGWNMKSFSPSDDYTVLLAGEIGVGGIMALPPDACERGAPACWQGYVAVDDVDAYAQRIQSKGGAILRAPEDIPNVGRFALTADPQGAVFVIFKPNSGEAMPTSAPGTPGLVGWNELHAVDGRKAFDWYADVFGWTKSRDMDMGPMGVYRLFATGGEPVGGMMTKMPNMPTPFWAYYFNVESINEAIARTNKAGGKVLHGPQEVPGPMYVANCQDPQGAFFSMVSSRR
jgi:predicted enzyme related to lactoylglutathione lyase